MHDHSGIYGLKLKAFCVTSAHIPSPRMQSYNHLHQQKTLGSGMHLCVQAAGETDSAI